MAELAIVKAAEVSEIKREVAGGGGLRKEEAGGVAA